MTELQDTIKDLKDQLSTLTKDFYQELVKIWSKLTEIETKLKIYIAIISLIVSATSSITTGCLVYFLTRG